MNSSKIKKSIRGIVKHYMLLIFSIIFGAAFSYYIIQFQPPGVDTDHLGIFNLVLLVINILYYSVRNTNNCPKCKEWMNTERIQRLEQGDIMMPSPYNVLEKYKCYNCGHKWDEYSEEKYGD